MLDDLRQHASESEFLQGKEPPPPMEIPRKHLLELLTPIQRFIIALVIFAGSLILGAVLLFATGSISLF